MKVLRRRLAWPPDIHFRAPIRYQAIAQTPAREVRAGDCWGSIAAAFVGDRASIEAIPDQVIAQHIAAPE